MKNAVSAGMKQVSAVRFGIGMLVMVVILGLSSLETLLRLFPVSTLLASDYHLDLLINGLRSEAVTPFIPMVAVLPFAASYVDDIKTKFARFLCVRSGNAVYLLSRICVCFLSGGTVIVAGILMALGVAAIIFIPVEQQAVEVPSPLTSMLLQVLFLHFLSGGFWAVVGMTMSTIMESKYISYASPFVFYYLLVILYDRYFSQMFLFDPRVWTTPTPWPFGCWGAAIFLIETTLIFAILFVSRAGRRLRQL